jgi:hypothetical protein
MNPYETPVSAVGVTSGESDLREAPSAVLTACKAQMKWQVALAILFAGFGALIPWFGFQVRYFLRLSGSLQGLDTAFWQMSALISTCIVGVVSMGVSLASFRYYRSLRTFSRDRRVVVLHAAMRRLRVLWRTFGIFWLLLVLLAASAFLMNH